MDINSIYGFLGHHVRSKLCVLNKSRRIFRLMVSFIYFFREVLILSFYFLLPISGFVCLTIIINIIIMRYIRAWLYTMCNIIDGS